MKYVIEIEDEPLWRQSALHGEDAVFKAKGFNALVFDKHGLDKLTPLDKELEEAYQKGVHEESLYVKERVDGAYQKGFEVGQHEATTLEYQQGLNDAWEFINKFGDFQYNDSSKVFGTSNIYKLARIMSCSEALEKFATYEQQKADSEIRVGDIITDGKINYLVIDITDNSYVALQGTDFEPSYIGKDYIGLYHNLHDSKDMRKMAEEINKAMKGGAE